MPFKHKQSRAWGVCESSATPMRAQSFPNTVAQVLQNHLPSAPNPLPSLPALSVLFTRDKWQVTSNRETKETIYLTPGRNMEFSCWGRIRFPAESVERNRGGRMCKEMSTGILPEEWVDWSGNGEISGERRSFHIEKKYLPRRFAWKYLFLLALLISNLSMISSL